MLAAALVLCAGHAAAHVVVPAPRDGAGPAVVDFEIVAWDRARDVVGALRVVDGGARTVEIHDLAAGTITRVEDLADADVAEVLEAAALARRPEARRIGSSRGRLRVALRDDDGVPGTGEGAPDAFADVEVAARPPTPGEIETDAGLRAWRDAREAAGRTYASNEVLVVVATISGRVVARRAFEVGAGGAVEPSAPYAFQDGGEVAIVVRLRGARGDALHLLPPFDVDEAVASLAALPKDDARVVAEAKAAAPSSAMPAPDEPVETKERDPLETLCCGLPMMGLACGAVRLFDFCAAKRR